MLNALYDEFAYKLNNTVYSNRLGGLGKKILAKKEKFNSLEIEEKCQVLYEILHIFQCNRISADLKLIDEKAGGVLTMSKNISSYENVCIVNQSPTGIYEQVIDLQNL